MTIDASIMLSVVLIILMPFLGFPRSWDDTIYFFLGVVVLSLGIVGRRKAGRRRESREFVESMPAKAVDNEETR